MHNLSIDFICCATAKHWTCSLINIILQRHNTHSMADRPHYDVHWYTFRISIKWKNILTENTSNLEQSKDQKITSKSKF